MGDGVRMDGREERAVVTKPTIQMPLTPLLYTENEALGNIEALPGLCQCATN